MIVCPHPLGLGMVTILDGRTRFHGVGHYEDIRGVNWQDSISIKEMPSMFHAAYTTGLIKLKRVMDPYSERH